MICCTIALTNQLPHARVLAASFKQHHDNGRFVIMLLDGGVGRFEAERDAEIIGWSGAGFQPHEGRQLPMLHSAGRLAEIVRPALLEMLLTAGNESVVYLPAETVIYGRLDLVVTLLKERDIVLTPPAGTSPAIAPGLTAASTRALAQLGRWKTAELTSDSTPFVPERALLLSEIQYELGFWNIDGHTLTCDGGQFFVDGAPLKSFWFAGYEPSKPHLLSKHQGIAPRVLLSENPVLLQLCEQYRGRLLAAGHSSEEAKPSRLDFLPSGLRIDERMRELYLEALQRFHRHNGPEPQSPFGPGGERTFLRWINQSVGNGAGIVTRYMTAIYRVRPDLAAAFPDFLNQDAPAFREWYLKHGRVELNLPDELLGDVDEGTELAIPARANITVAGYFRAELGIGEAARLLIAGLEATRLPFTTVGYDRTVSRQEHPFQDRQAGGGITDINIVCVNPDQFIPFMEQMGREFSEGRYTIGVWVWEVNEFPTEFHAAFNYVDEIWVATEFVRSVFLKVSPKPVFKFDLPLIVSTAERSLLQTVSAMPDGYCFLFSFDFLSVLERKNPLGLIDAFQRAFAAGEGPTLVLKTINGDQRILELEKLRFASRHRPDIKIIDGYLSTEEKTAMIARCDCYVSLHRAEGFGLTMAEAMAVGRPVIATGYSGNLEFMNATNSYLVSYTEAVVGPERQPYPAEALWAEPNVDDAAALMRHVYTHREEATQRGLRAAQDIRELHSAAVGARSIRERIETVRSRRAGTQRRVTLDELQDRVQALEKAQRELSRFARTRAH